MIKRVAEYLAGLTLVAFGINLAKLAGLGMSAVNSVPRALEIVTGCTFGTMIIVVYSLMVVLQFLILRKDFKLHNILGIPVGLLFGSLVDILGTDPNAIGHFMIHFHRPASYLEQLLYLAVSIVIVGTGVYVYMKPRLVFMPVEGFTEAVAMKTGKTFGDCKSIVDVSLALISLAVQLIAMGGMKSFSSPDVVVREGTVLSALLSGQIVKFWKKKRG